MPRRVFAIRFLRPPVPDAATAAQYLLAWHGPALYEQTAVFPLVTAPGLFGVAGPLHLEVAYEQDTCNFRTRKLQLIVSL